MIMFRRFSKIIYFCNFPPLKLINNNNIFISALNVVHISRYLHICICCALFSFGPVDVLIIWISRHAVSHLFYKGLKRISSWKLPSYFGMNLNIYSYNKKSIKKTMSQCFPPPHTVLYVLTKIATKIFVQYI